MERTFIIYFSRSNDRVRGVIFFGQPLLRTGEISMAVEAFTALRILASDFIEFKEVAY